MKPVTPEEIDSHLPQTQCGLCGYGGCLPYAEALVFEKAPINLCPPGGLATLHKLGELMNVSPSPYLSTFQPKSPSVAIIREAECIGCTKCIQACPVDAILGSAKQMHTVITDECTGCTLCVAPCPVDCIDLVSLENPTASTDHYRMRFQARNARIAIKTKAKKERVQSQSLLQKKTYIEEALQRRREKKK